MISNHMSGSSYTIYYSSGLEVFSDLPNGENLPSDQQIMRHATRGQGLSIASFQDQQVDLTPYQVGEVYHNDQWRPIIANEANKALKVLKSQQEKDLSWKIEEVKVIQSNAYQFIIQACIYRPTDDVRWKKNYRIWNSTYFKQSGREGLPENGIRELGILRTPYRTQDEFIKFCERYFSLNAMNCGQKIHPLKAGFKEKEKNPGHRSPLVYQITYYVVDETTEINGTYICDVRLKQQVYELNPETGRIVVSNQLIKQISSPELRYKTQKVVN